MYDLKAQHFIHQLVGEIAIAKGNLGVPRYHSGELLNKVGQHSDAGKLLFKAHELFDCYDDLFIERIFSFNLEQVHSKINKILQDRGDKPI